MNYYESFDSDILELFHLEGKRAMVFAVVMTAADYKSKRDKIVKSWVENNFKWLSDIVPYAHNNGRLTFSITHGNKAKKYNLVEDATGFSGTVTWTDGQPRSVSFKKFT